VDDWTKHRLAWRDVALDHLVTVLAGTKANAELARRLARYLEGAREIETQEHDGWDGARSTGRLAEWTAERLPELERKRIDSYLRPFAVEWLMLRGEFHAAKRDGDQTRPAWHARVQGAETLLAEAVTRKDLPGPTYSLTEAQRDEVIFTEAGKVRAPKAMAFRLLYKAFRPEADDEAWRIQLEHVKLAPPAL
jgi:hypothetical protein